ncbi:MAG: RnfABCDGE type electron transport complex subunit D [Desulfosalsimonadaceae bacterium]
MSNRMQLTVSHAPFWHTGSSASVKYYHIMAAAMIAVIAGLVQYGIPALAVIALSVGSAMIWESIFNYLAKRPNTIHDGNAALIGLLFAMLLPAVTPWWVVITGTFVAIVIGKQIYGGLGANPFNPVVVAYAILILSWPIFLDYNAALVDYAFSFDPAYPMAAAKFQGVAAVENFSITDLLMGRQTAGIGTGFGIGLIVGGVYLIVRGFIRWEIAVSFLAGIFVTALLFNLKNPEVYAGPAFHVFTGMSLIGAFFLATEDSSSPVNFFPMLIYGALGGFLTVLIRNIGVHVDGVIFALLIISLVNPIVDKIRPKAKRRVTNYA